ncbi:hypothetical protein ACWE42_02165 [Sutcliffiella cohnii]|uniref:Endolytic transglycosylase MltG n=1 Tax=Sutcliffiella cohnii TaxID=33932 RepID=A0A223KSX3_9BACI|nr:hypothetical protein [Sutcliffiella cohnii]AST92556.1 hypothetical protein BC6307_15280 [Sutcliffiella cohnii]
MNNSIRAFAIGILFATGVTGCAYAFEGSKEVVIEEGQVLSYAEENSLVVLSKEEYDQLLPQLDDLKDETTAKESTEPEEDKSVEEEVTKEEKIEEEEKEEPKEEKKEEPKTYTLTIREGMLLHEATKELENAGIIDNAFSFNQYLEKNDKSKLVQIGTFELTTGLSYREVTAIITKNR